MSKRNGIIGGIAVLLLLVLGTYFFFPSDTPSSIQSEKEKVVSFLEVDPHWADSLLKTMTIEEKAAMLILFQPKPEVKSDSAFLTKMIPGAFLLSSQNWLGKSKAIQNDQSLYFSSFDQIPVTDKVKFLVPHSSENTLFPNAEIFFSLMDDSLRRESLSILPKVIDFHQIDGIFLPKIGDLNSIETEKNIFRKDTSYYAQTIQRYGKTLVQENVLTGAACMDRFYESKDGSTDFADSSYKSLRSFSRNGFPLFFIDSNFSKKNLETESISKYLKSEFKFSGLCIAFTKEKEKGEASILLQLFLAGVDMVQTDNFDLMHLNILNLIRKGDLKENWINAKVKKILLAKTWCKLRKKKIDYTPIEEFSAYEKSLTRRIRKAAITLVKNEKSYLPIRNVTNNRMAVIHLGFSSNSFVRNLYHYLPDEQTVLVKSFKELKDFASLNVSEYKKFQTVIVTINEDISKNTLLLEKLDLLSKNSKLILLNFKNPANLPSLQKFSTILQLWDDSVIEFDFSAQAIMGGLGVNASLPLAFDKKFKLSKSVALKQSRLQYTIPEDIGIASDSLLKINYIVEEGIRNKAFPGAQVFFALDGKVFYNQSFGTHTYTDKQPVKVNDLFDMASVTKVAASTIVAMSTYEKGYYRLNDSLHKHLPDTLKKHIHGKSSLRNITFKQILVHATGLAAGQPIIRYIRYRDSLVDKAGRFDKFYCDYTDDYYTIKVAENFYMEKEQADTIWYAMNRMSVDENPSYRYSDANMNLLYKLLDAKIKNRWRFYLDSLFYKPMGMFNTCYLPIENKIKPERIVPTENDRYWRKQLLRGYVHDPTAALFGGVAGNAGLFSTAEDMGILFQMLIYKGSYGGNEYFKKETVELFISQQSGSHRGLGFNRQVKGNTYGVSPYASNNTFGHTGFTGISVWADMDIKLLYVSCTNRVHPEPDNKKIINLGTTKRIHNVVYEQLKYLLPDKIDLSK